MSTVAWLSRLGAFGFASLVALGGATAELPAIRIGGSGAFASGERLDVQRRGRSRSGFPTSPVRSWSLDLHSRLEHPPLVDSSGAISVMLANGDLVRITPEGALSWRRRVSCVLSNAPPALVGDAVVLFLCGDGSLQSVTRDGVALEPIALDGLARRVSAAPLVSEDGSVVIALDEELVRVSLTGAVVERVRLVSNQVLVGGLMPFEGGVLATDARGDVWHWRAPSVPYKLGSFGSSAPAGAVVLGTRALAAVVASGKQVVVLDPLTQRLSTLLVGDLVAGERFDAPPVLAPNGEVLVTTNLGEVLAISSKGEVNRRLALWTTTGALPTAATARAASPRKCGEPGCDTAIAEVFRSNPSAPPTHSQAAVLVVDPHGNAAAFGSRGLLAIVPAKGERSPVREHACARPIAVLPAGPQRLLTACGDGRLASWSEP